MPPPPRRRPQPQPTRRKVAGRPSNAQSSTSSSSLRKPAPKPSPNPRTQPEEAAETPEAVEPEAPGAAAPETEELADSGAGEDIAEATALANSDADPETTTEPATQSQAQLAEPLESTESAGKARPVGRAKRGTERISYPPQSEIASSSASTQAEDQTPRSEAQTRSRQTRIAVVLTVLAVLLGGFAVFAGLQASGATAPDDNEAIVDSKATNQVKQSATNALNTMFSYDYKNPKKTEADTKSLITGKVGGQYDGLMKVLRENGPSNKLKLSSAVLSLGVQRIEGDQARTLALMSQTYTKEQDNQQVPVLSMVRADLQRDGDSWKISGIKMLSS